MTRRGPGRKSERPPVGGSFKPVEGGFVLEHAGPVVRLWCDTQCDKHVRLEDDKPERIEAAKAVHVHGSRTTLWGSAG